MKKMIVKPTKGPKPVKSPKSLDKYGFGSGEGGTGGFDMSSMMSMFGQQGGGQGGSGGGFDFSSMMGGGGGGASGGAGGGYMKAMQMFQGIASSLASSTIAAAVDAVKHKGEEYRPVTMNTNRMMANGGIVPATKVEVEGDEVAETPAGDILQFTGPSHEQGGIDANLPPGTKVFSDRLSVDGKTMQERKKERERALARVNKFLKDDPTNGVHKSTAKRVSEINEAEEQADLVIQTIANQVYGQGQKLAYGTPALGTDPYASWHNLFYNNSGVEPTEDMYKQFSADKKYMDSPVGLFQNWVNDNYPGSLPKYGVDNKWGAESQAAYDKYGLEFQKKTNAPPMSTITAMPAQKIQAGVTPVTTLPSSISKVSGTSIPVDTTMDMTQGDKVGMAGQIQGALSPFFTTLMNRAGDKPNENHFQDFGVDALKANNDAKTVVAGLKNQALQDVTIKENGAIARNRNSTRGLSTQRALDLSAYMGGLDASNKVYGNFATQMANLYNIQSTLENQQDQMVMTGAKDKAMEDKADRDNFFTQINQDMSNISTQTQKMGKNMNVQKANNDFLSLLPELSKYGLGIVYDEKGKPVVTKVK